MSQRLWKTKNFTSTINRLFFIFDIFTSPIIFTCHGLIMTSFSHNYSCATVKMKSTELYTYSNQNIILWIPTCFYYCCYFPAAVVTVWAAGSVWHPGSHCRSGQGFELVWAVSIAPLIDDFQTETRTWTV